MKPLSIKPQIVLQNSVTSKEKFYRAVNERVNGNYNSAFEILKEVISIGSIRITSLAYAELKRVYELSNNENIFQYYTQHLSNDPTAKLTYAFILHAKNNIGEANNIRLNIADEYPNTETEKIALLDVFYSTLSYSKDDALTILNRLKTKYSEDPLIVEAEWLSQNILSIEKNKFGEGQSISISQPFIFDLHQNYPNPFNPSTTISYTIPEANFVELNVYDYLGREISTMVKEYKNAGGHSVAFNGNSLSSGVYFYKLKSGINISMKKMLLLR